nr:40S ribosomal protein S27 [Oryctolagus cuniculus]
MLLGLSGGDEQPAHMNVPLKKDLLRPSPEGKREHKKKHLVQSPSSYFMDLRCPGCAQITAFSHAQMVGLCGGCSTVIHQPRGGKARLSEGCPFRRKQHSEHPESRFLGNLPNKHILDDGKECCLGCLHPISGFESCFCF